MAKRAANESNELVTLAVVGCGQRGKVRHDLLA